MAITILSNAANIEISPFSRVIRWSSSLGADTEVTIYQDGRYLATTRDTEWTFTVPFTEATNIQIIDADETFIAGVSSRRSVLNWYESEDENPNEVDYYRIDLNDGGWSEVNRIPADGSANYSWTTPYLPNLATVAYRIVAVGVNENEGAAREINVTPVGYDDIPVAAYVLDTGTGKVTVTLS